MNNQQKPQGCKMCSWVCGKLYKLCKACAVYHAHDNDLNVFDCGDITFDLSDTSLPPTIKAFANPTDANPPKHWRKQLEMLGVDPDDDEPIHTVSYGRRSC